VDAYLNYACALGCEGIVSKRVGSLDQGQEPGGAAVRRKIGHSACAEQETDNPLLRMTAIFCKVENWSRNGLRVELMLYAGNNLDKARRVFERTHRKRTTTSMRTIS
jgi:hypothetical protein